MPNTYSYTFTRAEVVLAQFKNALAYANVLSKVETELLLEAISEKKISSMGIYAYNSDDERVMEVVIKVDWDKHQLCICALGDIFENEQVIFNDIETKVLLNRMMKSAKENSLNLSIRVRPSKTITGKEREDLLKKLGFDGGTL